MGSIHSFWPISDNLAVWINWDTQMNVLCNELYKCTVFHLVGLKNYVSHLKFLLKPVYKQIAR